MTAPRAVQVAGHRRSGPAFDILVIADGYRRSDSHLFVQRVSAFVQELFRLAPFDLLRGLVTVHRLDLWSPTGSSRFAAAFTEPPPGRLLVVDQVAVAAVAADVRPGADMVLLQSSLERFGGSGGSVAAFSGHPAAVGIAVHEMGHTAFGLGDEYDYPPHDDAEAETRHPARHPGPEPPYPNLTACTDWSRLKWLDLVSPGAALPTTDPSVEVGAFEGGDYHREGVYRASWTCRMRQLDAPFCPVCQLHIRRTLLGRLAREG